MSHSNLKKHHHITIHRQKQPPSPLSLGEGLGVRLLLLLLLFPHLLHAQQDTLRFRIMSYNVENLFDCRDDSLKADEEFLPDAVRHWNYRKYWKKLNNVARVITAVGEWHAPALVALCEVENDTVLFDLTRRSILREAGYRYVMTDSPDERGIDVALLYQRGKFKLLSHRSIPIAKPRKESRPTRDILHVSGMLLNRDTLDVFVCHFPSRSGGTKETEPYRLLAARTLRRATDSITLVRRRPQIVIMGDLNDYPDDKSVQTITDNKTYYPQTADYPQAADYPLSPLPLHHLLAHRSASEKSFGSYKYRGEWGLFDHIIISSNLLHPDAPLHTDDTHANIFHAPFLLTEDSNYGGEQPFRTYYGMKYQGGFSDHLPVWAEFRLVY